MSESIKVAVTGAGGKMGRTVCQAVLGDDQLALVGAVDGAAAGQPVPGSDLKILASIDEVFAAASVDVLVDFTRADAVMRNIDVATAGGAHAVIGTTGLSDNDFRQLQEWASSRSRNILLAPNFALGAVIMMKICEKVAPFFDRAEIIELHHDQKHDAPSGTATLTAEMIGNKLSAEPLEEVEKFPGARGALVNGVPVHSVRLPGLVAHQEVIFGLLGQVMTIRHDSIARSSFMPGVIMAVKAISERSGFTYGLDKLLDI